MKADQLVEARWAKESSCVMIHSFYPYWSFCDLDIALDLLQLLEHFNIWGSISVIFQEKIQTFPQIIGFFFFFTVLWYICGSQLNIFFWQTRHVPSVYKPDSKLPPIFFFLHLEMSCPVLRLEMASKCVNLHRYNPTLHFNTSSSSAALPAVTHVALFTERHTRKSRVKSSLQSAQPFSWLHHSVG